MSESVALRFPRCADSLVAVRLSVIRVAQQLNRHRLVSQSKFTKCAHDLVHGCARRPVLVKEVSTKKDKVDLNAFDRD